MQDDESRCLVNRNLPFPIDRSKEVNCDHLLLRARPLIQILLGKERSRIFS